MERPTTNTPLGALSENSRANLRSQPQPQRATPTLATLVHEPFGDRDWLFEPKLEGERCLVINDSDDVRILSRNEKDLNNTYPEIVHAVREQIGDVAVLEGEIVAFDGGRTSFAQLQQRMQTTIRTDHASSS